jgi:nucleotide-binding universal stress UspA family protein
VVIRHVVVASDESPEGYGALEAAAALAVHGRARLSVLHVEIASEEAMSGTGVPGTIAPLERSVEALRQRYPELKADARIAYGIPAIEISRFAEDQMADLLVLGRKHRSQATRLLLGDTADAVVRRSPVCCLFVPQGRHTFTRILVALDGTERGLAALYGAMALARLASGSLRSVLVDPASRQGAPEGSVPEPPSARAHRLQQALEALGRTPDANGLGVSPSALRIRHGDPVSEILNEIGQNTDVLALGYHRGGPPSSLEDGSVSRRLSHVAPCAVMTIPL